MQPAAHPSLQPTHHCLSALWHFLFELSSQSLSLATFFSRFDRAVLVGRCSPIFDRRASGKTTWLPIRRRRFTAWADLATRLFRAKLHFWPKHELIRAAATVQPHGAIELSRVTTSSHGCMIKSVKSTTNKRSTGLLALGHCSRCARPSVRLSVRPQARRTARRGRASGQAAQCHRQTDTHQH